MAVVAIVYQTLLTIIAVVAIVYQTLLTIIAVVAIPNTHTLSIIIDCLLYANDHKREGSLLYATTVPLMTIREREVCFMR